MSKFSRESQSDLQQATEMILQWKAESEVDMEHQKTLLRDSENLKEYLIKEIEDLKSQISTAEGKLKVTRIQRDDLIDATAKTRSVIEILRSEVQRSAKSIGTQEERSDSLKTDNLALRSDKLEPFLDEASKLVKSIKENEKTLLETLKSKMMERIFQESEAASKAEELRKEVKKQKEELESENSKLLDLGKNISEAETQCEKIQNEKNTIHEEILRVSESLDNQKSKIENLKAAHSSQIQGIKTKILEMKSRIKAQKQKIEEGKIELENQRKEEDEDLLPKIRQLESDLNRINSEKQSLLQDPIEDDLVTAKERLAQAVEESNRWKSQCEEQREKKNILSDELNELTNQVNEAENRVKEFQNATELNNKLKTSVNDLKKEIEELKAQVNAKDEKLQELDLKIDELTTEKDSLSREHSDRVNQLQSKWEEEESLICELKEQILTREAEKKKLIKDHSEKLVSLEEGKRKDISVLENNYILRQEKKSELKIRLETLTSEKEEYTAKLEALNAEKSQLEDQLKTLTDHHLKLSEQIKVERSAKGDEIKLLKQKLEEARAKSRELEKLKQEESALKEEIEKQLEMINEKEIEHQARFTQTESINKITMAKYKESIDMLEEENKKLKDAISDLKLNKSLNPITTPGSKNNSLRHRNTPPQDEVNPLLAQDQPNIIDQTPSNQIKHPENDDDDISHSNQNEDDRNKVRSLPNETNNLESLRDELNVSPTFEKTMMGTPRASSADASLLWNNSKKSRVLKTYGRKNIRTQKKSFMDS